MGQGRRRHRRCRRRLSPGLLRCSRADPAASLCGAGRDAHPGRQARVCRQPADRSIDTEHRADRVEYTVCRTIRQGSTMTTMPPVSPEIKQDIHFDTLLEQARADIAVQAAQTWTDTTEHDPGVTLLEALAYNVSDLSYRHVLPLTDLLTPSDAPGQTIFPEVFGPHRALTCAPLTPDDYRRALLDLYDEANQRFYFRNVQLLPLNSDDPARYRYSYNVTDQVFTFSTALEGETIEEKCLLGDYILYLEHARDVTAEQARPALDEFLLAHRNLGEGVRKIVNLSPAETALNASIDLDDDAADVAAVLVAQGWRSDAIYQGPELQHGWITQLPPELDYSVDRITNFMPLLKQWAAIPGVKSIRSFATPDAVNPWLEKTSAGQYRRAFGVYPITYLADGQHVKLFKRGRQVTATVAEIKARRPVPAVPTNTPITLSAGRWRNPARYKPAGQRLPACYQLQNPQPDGRQTRLHQFLLPFEQQLANGCDQLARLPALLSFLRQDGGEGGGEGGNAARQIWGSQWPFAADTIPNAISNEVHDAYRGALEDYSRNAAQSTAKELDIIDYLLSYFGEQRASRTLLLQDGDDAWLRDFLAVQRGYLQQITELTYGRANIRVDRVSAVQRRIAARLGWAPELFDQADPALDTLPFYIVERRALLPQQPDPAYNAPQTSLALDYALDDGGNVIGLTLTVADGVTLKVGQLIDFVLGEGGAISSNIIRRIDDQVITLLYADNRRLERNAERLIEAQAEATLEWNNSDVWLYDMSYELAYAEEDGASLPEGQRRLTVKSFPQDMAIDDTVIFTLQQSATDQSVTADAGSVRATPHTATVIQFDPVSGLLVLAMPAAEWADIELTDVHRWRWHVVPQEGRDPDRFSFMVSVVFNRAIVQNVADTEAAVAWIRQVVADEMPAHIVPRLHWLGEQYFGEFGSVYAQWQNNGQPLGDLSYRLLELLAIGQLREDVGGINALRIATQAQHDEAVGEDGSQWDFDYIKDNELFYVPSSDMTDLPLVSLRMTAPEMNWRHDAVYQGAGAFIAFDSEVGPVDLISEGEASAHTLLHISLSDADGVQHAVVLRATKRNNPEHLERQMNDRGWPGGSLDGYHLKLSYLSEANPDVPNGRYSGYLNLALAYSDAEQKTVAAKRLQIEIDCSVS